MTRIQAWFTSLLCAGALSAAMSGSAQAALYGFTIAPFTDGATLTIQFEGADNNNDGVIYGFYPADCGCVPDPTEITSLSLAFSGNSLIPSFTASSTDFSSLEQSLIFEAEFGDGFELLYVLVPDGPGVAFFELPSGVVAGDAIIALGGVIGSPERSTALAGAFTAEAIVQILGSPCGSVLGLSGGEPGAPCGMLGYEGQFLSDFDFAQQEVPEPLSLLGFGAGLLGLTWVRRRRGHA